VGYEMALTPMKVLKVYCDVAAFPNNALHKETKTEREAAGIKKLFDAYAAGKIALLGSLVCLREVTRTAAELKRDALVRDFDSLQRVSKDEKLLGFNTVYDQYGGFCTSPLISDIQDDRTCERLIQQGLDQKDAEHITQAICNDCDVFLTRDERTIIRRHREWIENNYRIRVMLPSELIATVGLR
jgi:hypothetical protein